jgi:hypothetical protein
LGTFSRVFIQKNRLFLSKIPGNDFHPILRKIPVPVIIIHQHTVEIDLKELRQLLADAAELGAKMALIESGQERGYLKQSEAFRVYGRATVERWIREGVLKPIKDGQGSSTVRLDKMELAQLAKTSQWENRIRPRLEAEAKARKLLE